MKIYTRTGDRGETSLFGGGRVAKDAPRVAAYGSVDELNSFIGSAVTVVEDGDAKGLLTRIQADLFSIGAILASPKEESDRAGPRTPELPVDRVGDMERWIDDATGRLAPLRNFILPGGTPGAAALHVARTVCRRAERAIVAIGTAEQTHTDIIRYLNRLSDLLFVMARWENRRAGEDDAVWRSG
jgi:cob(I)alamin adenosyltransferase